MRTRQMHYRFGWMGIAAVLAACNLNAPCNQESRSITSTGAIGAYGARELFAQVEVHQTKGSSQSDQLAWELASDLHAGHVTGVTLYDSRTSRTLATFPIQNSGAVIFSQSTTASGNSALSATPGEIYDIIGAGTAHVRATTDLAAPAMLDVPLSVSSKSDWGKMGCAG